MADPMQEIRVDDAVILYRPIGDRGWLEWKVNDGEWYLAQGTTAKLLPHITTLEQALKEIADGRSVIDDAGGHDWYSSGELQAIADSALTSTKD